ncbi:FAD-dependent oxidoreductase [Anaerobaca lacustris]|uniref:FAD-dependent oxidoreductase n=1 Tax=Anaerobaca lacustris TaxID=3044600 RepID=A0AAW6TZ63_9BACT|nr:FAD-dependent oxidoreductase [Sedimentisphaerales bacterium M17dextr]
MTRHLQRTAPSMLLGLLLLSASCSRPATHPSGGRSGKPVFDYGLGAITESSRSIPVAYDVDVLVVGGSSAGVAAAAAAAQNGARVFLAAPRPYLGEDLCATYRLWLEPGEEPRSDLTKALFAEPEAARQLANAMTFTYEADVASSPRHKDTNPPSILTDGKWHSAATQSVQYDGDATITADLGDAQRVRRVRIMAYQRNDDFEVDTITIHISQDRKGWSRAAVIKNGKLGHGSFESAPIELSAWLDNTARYVRLSVKKSAVANRILLGEIVIEKPAGSKPSSANRVPPSPMQIKRVLDDTLLDAGVEFLYGCYATDVLRDENGHPAGIVMSNRSGRQAIRAKVVIDATDRALVARMAGAEFDPYATGWHTFQRTVVGGTIRQDEYMEARRLPTPVHTAHGRTYEAVEYTLKIPMENGSFASFANAEQIARDKTWSAGQVDCSETLFQVPPDRMKGKARECCTWPGADRADLNMFRPERVERLFVLGGCADMARSVAEKLLRPLELMGVGERIGQAAAVESLALPPSKTATAAGQRTAPLTRGDVREDTAWMRPDLQHGGTVEAAERAIPILGSYDVVVIGGGTGGAPAGISAARQGARTLVVEYLHGLGGIGTMGLIGRYYYGYREGFTKEIDEGLADLGGPAEGISGRGGDWDSQLKIEWYRRELRKAGADIWYGAFGCGALVEGRQVQGVVVATPQGRGVVLAKVVIDATGSASIAAAAGADCIYTSAEHIAIQGTGLPPWEPGARYTNTDYTFIDDLDAIDAWRSFLTARKKFDNAYDLAQIVDSRERRQIVGDFFLCPSDAYLGRTFPDTIVRANSNFDTHGFTIHPMFLLKPPDREAVPCYVPYRCLLPKGLEGILVTGLGVSAHRDVMPVIRMQPDIQNQGYAAGLAAVMAIGGNGKLRDIHIRTLQQHLVDKGNLPAEVLDHKDSLPLPKERIERAVASLTNGFEGIEIIYAQPEAALPLLRQAYDSATSDEDKLTYAHILGIMGDGAGAATLTDAVRQRDWDEGWRYTGMGQYGMSMSPVDSLIVALGRTGRKEALDPIIEKIAQLGPDHALSHHRAVAMALEAQREPSTAQALADLLRKDGMTGHAFTDIHAVTANIPASPVDTSTREVSLRELILARALYRCGDDNGLGERILRQYARDMRGHYARHALAVLNEQPGRRM